MCNHGVEYNERRRKLAELLYGWEGEVIVLFQNLRFFYLIFVWGLLNGAGLVLSCALCSRRVRVRVVSKDVRNKRCRAGLVHTNRGLCTCLGGRGYRSSKISDFFTLIFVWRLLPKTWGPLPDFGEHSPFNETRRSRNMFSLE